MYQPFESFLKRNKRKSISWYDRNFIKLTPKTWRSLRQNDILLWITGPKATISANIERIAANQFGGGEIEWGADKLVNIDISMMSNFKLVEGKTKTYEYDISNGKISTYWPRQIIIEEVHDRHHGYSMAMDVAGENGWYLMKPEDKAFLNYSRLPKPK